MSGQLAAELGMANNWTPLVQVRAIHSDSTRRIRK
jgi:hypothetical protein